MAEPDFLQMTEPSSARRTRISQLHAEMKHMKLVQRSIRVLMQYVHTLIYECSCLAAVGPRHLGISDHS